MKKYLNFIRESKKEKQLNKIKKFVGHQPIIDFIFDNTVSGNKGLQYVVWFANEIKKYLMDEMRYLQTAYQKYKNKISMEEYQNIIKKIIEGGDKSLYPDFDDDIEPFLNGLKSRVKTISDWLNSPIRDEKIKLSDYNIKTAYQKADEWHKQLKATGVVVNETGTILMTFDDGYYWIDLETTSSEDEAESMGHCGTTSYGDTLYSLRKNMSPHVTAAIGNDGTVYQMKGKENKKPVKKYHKYILELLCYPNVGDNVKVMEDFTPISRFSTTEYESYKDFHVSDLDIEDIERLSKNNPDLVIGLGVNYKLWKNNMITIEEFTNKYKDLIVVDDEIHFIVDHWSSFSDCIYQDSDYRKKWWENYIGENFYGNEDYDYDHVTFEEWDDLTEETLQEIINWIVKNDIHFEDVKLDKSNLEISPNKDDVWFKLPSGMESLKDNIDDDEFEDLKQRLDQASGEAQRSADEDEAYKSIIDDIINHVGEMVKYKDGTYWWRHGKLHFKPNFDKIIEAENSVEDDSVFNSVLDILESASKDHQIKLDIPYYGWYGTIDKSVLNECVQDRLNW